MALTPQDVHKLSQLARIEITEQDVDQTLGQLNDIFGLIERMQAEPTDGVAPMSHPQDAMLRLRDDVVTEPDQRALYQGVAPATDGGLYLVPRVIE